MNEPTAIILRPSEMTRELLEIYGPKPIYIINYEETHIFTEELYEFGIKNDLPMIWIN